jgi:hypothetical protein
MGGSVGKSRVSTNRRVVEGFKYLGEVCVAKNDT